MNIGLGHKIVSGAILLPPNCGDITAKETIIEIRDTSLIDAASVCISIFKIGNVKLSPNSKIPFNITIPMPPAGKEYSFRVQINVSDNGTLTQGDLVSFQRHSVSPNNDNLEIIIPVQVV